MGVRNAGIAGRSRPALGRVFWLERFRSCPEVGGAGVARYVGVAYGIHGDAPAFVDAAAPEIGGVNECRAGGIELRDEGVPALELIAAGSTSPPSEAGLEGSRSCRKEVRAVGIYGARHIRVADGVHG